VVRPAVFLPGEMYNYSNRSTIRDITFPRPFPSRESIAIRDCAADGVIATMERVY
jgi:hypothetical protein